MELSSSATTGALHLKEIIDWVTVIGAGVAAITGIWNLLLQLQGKRDIFTVRLDSVSPSIGPETMMNVVSHSDHPIKITDYGFIEADGKFRSFHMDWEAGAIHSEEISSRGSSELAGFGEYFESGYVRKILPFGAYAISVTQKRPRLYFTAKMPYMRRVWIKLRLWFQPHYLAW